MFKTEEFIDISDEWIVGNREDFILRSTVIPLSHQFNFIDKGNRLCH